MMLIGYCNALAGPARDASTSQEALLLAHEQGVPLGHIVCEHARQFALSVVPEGIGGECFAIDRQGRIVGAAQ